MNDYRNTPFCPTLSDVNSQKENLQNQIYARHPRSKNIYSKIHTHTSEYFSSFARIYNKKCAYCGISTDVHELSEFEIDHFICESSFADKIEAGQIANLRFSCKFCNRKKSGFLLEGKYKKLLDPDDNLISYIFERKSDYQIVIAQKYAQDEMIKNFYNQLDFSNQFRRLDHLLMNMIAYSKHTTNLNIQCKLNDCIELLRRKRNNLTDIV